MNFFWTLKAWRQYLKHYPDTFARDCLDGLVSFVEDDPTRGREMGLLEGSEDPWEKRAAKALREANLIEDARVVLANVHRPAVRGEPWALGAVIHTPEVPPDVEGQPEHTILLVGVILRTDKFD